MEVVVGELPQAWPAGEFDLVVLSELGYYFTTEHWARLVGRSVDALTKPGVLLAAPPATSSTATGARRRSIGRIRVSRGRLNEGQAVMAVKHVSVVVPPTTRRG